MKNSDKRPAGDGPVLMDHEFDGIREYDQRLPNWWLATLYGAIIFSALYWFYYFQSNIGKDDRVAVNAELATLEAKQLAALKELDDETLWKMSRNANIVTAGESTFKNTCAACHGPEGAGVKGIGFRLTDNTWVHGHKPMQIFTNINKGITYEGKPTGMAAQGQLGAGKVAEVVAFLLSKQKPEEMKDIPRGEEPSQK